MSKDPFGWDYPAGAEHDPRAPYNQVELRDCPICKIDIEDCPHSEDEIIDYYDFLRDHYEE